MWTRLSWVIGLWEGEWDMEQDTVGRATATAMAEETGVLDRNVFSVNGLDLQSGWQEKTSFLPSAALSRAACRWWEGTDMPHPGMDTLGKL